jgi:DNA-binding CsgD family transcriptional regulator
MRQDFETLVGSIYDCAADPSLWPQALGYIREAVDAVYVGIEVSSDRAVTRHPVLCHQSPGTSQAAQDIRALIEAMPNDWALHELPEDASWTPLSQMDEDDFQKTDVFQEFLRPFGLRDVLGLNSIKRRGMRGCMAMPTAAHREPVTAENRALVEKLSPHIRRAITINDLSNNSALTQSLYRQVLDNLSTAVFIIGPGHTMMFTNTQGEAMLSAAHTVLATGGVFKAHRSAELDVAIGRTLAGLLPEDTAKRGVPLVGRNGELDAAYVVPLSAKSYGMSCCAVFVTRMSASTALAVDVLRGLYHLTVTEARVALLIAHGEAPQRIALSLGIAMNTVRTHLKHIYAKMDVSDQAGLAGRVSGLLPPVT